MACNVNPNAIGALGKMCFKKQSRISNPCYGDKPLNSDLTDAIAISAPSEGVNFDRVYVEEEVINGERFTTDMIPTARAVSGDLPINAHPEQIGWFAYGVLGAYKTPKFDDGTSFVLGHVKAPLGSIFITYSGASRSALLTKSGNNLTSKIGNEGAEITDAVFGTIDLTTYTTVSALATYIDSIADYEAFYIGDGTAPTSNFRDFTDMYIKNTAIKIESIDEGYVIVSYTGTQASALLSIDKTALTLSSKIGAAGAEALDPAFGTAGVINLLDVDGASGTTLTALQAEIDAYADYTATLVGNGALLARHIINFNETQIKTPNVKNLYSAEAIRHRLVPVSAGQSTPSFFFLFDRVMDIYGYTGMKMGDISLEMTPRSIITGSVTLVGQDEILKDYADADLTYPTIALEDTRPFIASKLDVYINGVKTEKCSSMTFNMVNNLNTEMVKLGSELVDEPQPMMGEINLDMEFYMNADTNVFRQRYTEGQNMEVILVATGFEKADSGQTIERQWMMRFKDCVITAAPVNLSSRDTLTMSLSVKVVKPKYYAAYPAAKRYNIIEWDIVTNESDYDL